MESYITSHLVSVGTQIEPIKRIQIMDADTWEVFIEEWLDTKKSDYINIDRQGGAGDMGRDVIAYISDPKELPDGYKWDCYQCKHYTNSLYPANAWVEIGKIIYYTFKEEYPVPTNYYFVAPLGVGTSLANILNNPKKLKSGLIANWDKYCKDKITKTESVALEGDLLKYFDDFDFKIFDKVLPKKIVEEHKRHANHLLRFGGGLPLRNSTVNIPPIDHDSNLRYIDQLIKAYNSDSQSQIQNISLVKDTKYEGHFERARQSFYSAEELKAFTRDNLPVEAYEQFQNNIMESIINIAEDDFDNNGFKKVKATEDRACVTTVDSNAIKDVCQNADKKGVCHQLVNDEQISWIDDE